MTGLITRIQAILTRLFIRILKRSKFEETRELSLLDEPTTVYVFRKSGSIFAQCTPFGTIIWNAENTEQLSHDGRRFVLTHELSHKKRNSVYKGITYGVLLSFAMAGGTFLSSLGLLLLGLSLSSVAPLAILTAATLLILCILLRIEETKADYDTLNELGEQDFRTAYNEVLDSGSTSLISSLVRKVMYSSPEQTIRLQQFLQKVSG